MWLNCSNKPKRVELLGSNARVPGNRVWGRAVAVTGSKVSNRRGRPISIPISAYAHCFQLHREGLGFRRIAMRLESLGVFTTRSSGYRLIAGLAPYQGRCGEHGAEGLHPQRGRRNRASHRTSDWGSGEGTAGLRGGCKPLGRPSS